jgi:uncharacterized phage protein (TIGR01671 family)
MKRVILFRGKTHDGEWIEGDLSQYKDNVTINPTESSFMFQDRKEVIPETVGQFIGILDKNKKKIFEGDIVSWIWDNATTDTFKNYHDISNNILPDGTYGDPPEVVEYYKNQCRFNTNNDSELFLEEYKYTIIGNIHDNPEL